MCASGGDDSTLPAVVPVVVRDAGAADAPAMARLHASEITDGFLSSLGPRFLERLYRRLCRTEGSFALVAEVEGTVAGFVAGSAATRRLFTSFVARDGMAVVLASPLRLLRSWRLALETLGQGRAGDADDERGGELLAIAVGPAWRRRGVARRLTEALLQGAAQRGARVVDVVVGSDNHGAIAMYRAAGFEPLRSTEVHRGTSSTVMRHTRLPSDGDGAATVITGQDGGGE